MIGHLIALQADTITAIVRYLEQCRDFTPTDHYVSGMYLWLMMLVGAVLIVAGAIIALREPTPERNHGRSLGVGTALIGLGLLLTFAASGPLAVLAAVASVAVALVLFARTLLVSDPTVEQQLPLR